MPPKVNVKLIRSLLFQNATKKRYLSHIFFFENRYQMLTIALKRNTCFFEGRGGPCLLEGLGEGVNLFCHQFLFCLFVLIIDINSADTVLSRLLKK